jgi:tetratricopeptide (TPR) repeat protein
MHVVRADGSENVLLMDFGIAALLGDEAGRLTDRGMRCGTPAYMAPEFIETGAFDRRADVYALATVAFEMLTGALPFDDAYAQRMLYAKTNRPAPSLRAVSGTRFDEAIERVIARGLARDPALRYPSTGEFVAALERAARDGVAEPVAGDAPTVRVRAPLGKSTIAPLRRGTRVRRAALGVALLALLAAAALSLAHRAPSAAPSAANAAQPSAAPVAVVVTPPATDNSAAIAPDPVVVPSASAPAAASDSDAAQARAPVLGAHAPRRRAAAAPAPNQVAPSRSAPSEPPPELRAIAGDAPPPGPDRAEVDALERAADRELLSGHLARAVELFERALAMDTKRIAAYRGLGIAHERLGHTAAAVHAYRSALALEPDGEHSGQLRARLQRLEADQ